LLGLSAERAICTPTSGYVFVAQLRNGLPASIGNLLWFAYGPADTSCFIPVYAGVTDLPDTWDQPANFTRLDRQQAQWNFRLVHNLTQRLPYSSVIREVRSVIGPAEAAWLARQPELEQALLRIARDQGASAVEALLTAYTSDCARRAGSAYLDLVDYLLFRFLAGDPAFASPALPRIGSPSTLLP
jgi:dipeptidase